MRCAVAFALALAGGFLWGHSVGMKDARVLGAIRAESRLNVCSSLGYTAVLQTASGDTMMCVSGSNRRKKLEQRP